MYNMFNECKSLISLPDLSIWNTSNVTYMDRIFKGCESVISLPDISKWNISVYKDKMFDECFNCLNINLKIYSIK